MHSVRNVVSIEISMIYHCGHCDYKGYCYGIGHATGVSAPFCKRCQRNDKLRKLPQVNGNIHLDNMKVECYNTVKPPIKVVTEVPAPGSVRVTIYAGNNITPISKETYGVDGSNLDKHG